MQKMDILPLIYITYYLRKNIRTRTKWYQRSIFHKILTFYFIYYYVVDSKYFYLFLTLASDNSISI